MENGSQNISELMNENVQNLAAGVFVYERPRLRFDVSKIEIDAISGHEVSGTFSFAVSKDQIAHGLVFATSVRMRLNVSEFADSFVEVRYYFDGTGMEEGDIIKGDICVISDCGEYSIPFVASRKRQALLSSQGPIKNLFHFTNLAQENFEEACKVFYSKEFINVFVNHDRQFIDLYRGLSKTVSAQNVEEFLISIKKKHPIKYQIETDIAGTIITKSEMIGVKIIKSGWGVVSLHIESDNEAVMLDQHDFKTVDFSPYAALLLTVDYEKLHNGKNYIRLIMSFPGGEDYFEFCLIKNPVSALDHAGFIKYQKYKTQILNTYIDFRIHNINKTTWEKKTLQLTERVLLQDENDLDAMLFRAHVLIEQGKINEGKNLLDKLPQELSATRYGYKRYIECMMDSDIISLNATAKLVGELYRKDRTSGLLWLLLYVDQDIKSSPMSALKLLYHHSEDKLLGPLLLLEIYHIFTKNPELCTGENPLDIKVLNFATKTGLFLPALSERAINVAEKSKTFSPILHRVLVSFYEEYKSDELLNAICTHLIRGEKTDVIYNGYYRKAIDKNLRITRLYEFYVYSLPKNFKELLPKAVRMYFSYDNNLDAVLQSKIYANLIANKADCMDDYNMYHDRMISFAATAIEKHRINEDVAYIIKEFSRNIRIVNSIMANVDESLFIHHVTINRKNIKYLVVVENPFVEEAVCPVKNNEVYVNIYSKEYNLFLEDYNGQRFAVTDNSVTDVTLIGPSLFPDCCYECDNPGLGVAIAVCELDGRGVTINERNEYFIRMILESKSVLEEYKREYRGELLQFYYDTDQVEKLDRYLLSVDPKVITPYDRDKLVEFLVRRDLQETAYGIVSVYGGENIDPRLMVKLCSKVISSIDNEMDPGLLHLSFMAFESGKYDMTTLSYLTQHYSGTAKQLRNLHRSAMNFDLETVFLEERLLKQMLFTGSFVAHREEIIEHYYRYFPFSTLSLACISCDAWEYFAHDAITSEALFDRIINTAREGNRLNEVCSLSLIKYYAEHSERLSAVPEVYSYIRKHLSQGVFFPFFLEFADDIEELEPYINRTYLEYRANPSTKVVLHYLLEGGENEDIYEKEELNELKGGNYVKSFLMFYGENLQYYITEISKGKENLTESLEISKTDRLGSKHENRYDVLNDMLISYNLKDDKSLFAMMDLYHKKDFITKKIFTIKGEN